MSRSWTCAALEAGNALTARVAMADRGIRTTYGLCGCAFPNSYPEDVVVGVYKKHDDPMQFLRERNERLHAP